MPDSVPGDQIDQAPLEPGATRVNDELEVGYDESFEARFRLVERLGWLLLFVVVGAALLGLLGHGPFSHARTEVVGGLSADYEPVARYDAPTQVTLHIASRSPGDSVQIRLTSKMIEPMGLTMIQPQPVMMQTAGGDVLLTIAGDRMTPDNLVRLQLKPAVVGLVSLAAAIAGEPTLRWTQLVLP